MEVEELPVILLRRQGKDAVQGVVLVANKIYTLKPEVQDTMSTLK
jgi:hypothetical protein